MSTCGCVPRSRVYMADLESTLHYSLRVELAAHAAIRGQALVSLKKYISVLTKVKDAWESTAYIDTYRTHKLLQSCAINWLSSFILIYNILTSVFILEKFQMGRNWVSKVTQNHKNMYNNLILNKKNYALLFRRTSIITTTYSSFTFNYND